MDSTNNVIAYKSNALIESSYRLTLQEQRLLLLATTKLDSFSDSPSNTVTITVKEFVKAFPDDSRNVFANLSNAVNTLFDRVIYIKENDVEYKFRWIQYQAIFKADAEKVQIVFSDAVMPYLTQLSKRFSRININNIASLKRVHSIRLYELLIQYMNIGERSFTIEAFKNLMGLDGGYPEFKHLNNQVISVAVLELNKKSNLFIEVELTKIRRVCTEIKFKFKIK
ncbi:MAG: replication initiation protein [Aeromonas sp.]